MIRAASPRRGEGTIRDGSSSSQAGASRIKVCSIAAANHAASSTSATVNALAAAISTISSAVIPLRAICEIVGANASESPMVEGRTTIGMRKTTIPPRTRKPASATGHETGWARVARRDETRIAPSFMGRG